MAHIKYLEVSLVYTMKMAVQSLVHSWVHFFILPVVGSGCLQVYPVRQVLASGMCLQFLSEVKLTREDL